MKHGRIEREWILGEVRDEMARQIQQWGDSFEGRDPDEWLAILLEEVGEAVEASREDDARSSDGHLTEELVQIAAVACTWIRHIEMQGRTSQSPQYVGLAAAAMNLGDRARDALES